MICDRLLPSIGAKASAILVAVLCAGCIIDSDSVVTGNELVPGLTGVWNFDNGAEKRRMFISGTSPYKLIAHTGGKARVFEGVFLAPIEGADRTYVASLPPTDGFPGRWLFIVKVHTQWMQVLEPTSGYVMSVAKSLGIPLLATGALAPTVTKADAMRLLKKVADEPSDATIYYYKRVGWFKDKDDDDASMEKADAQLARGKTQDAISTLMYLSDRGSGDASFRLAQHFATMEHDGTYLAGGLAAWYFRNAYATGHPRAARALAILLQRERAPEIDKEFEQVFGTRLYWLSVARELGDEDGDLAKRIDSEARRECLERPADVQKRQSIIDCIEVRRGIQSMRARIHLEADALVDGIAETSLRRDRLIHRNEQIDAEIEGMRRGR